MIPLERQRQRQQRQQQRQRQHRLVRSETASPVLLPVVLFFLVSWTVIRQAQTPYLQSTVFSKMTTFTTFTNRNSATTVPTVTDSDSVILFPTNISTTRRTTLSNHSLVIPISKELQMAVSKLKNAIPEVNLPPGHNSRKDDTNRENSTSSNPLLLGMNDKSMSSYHIRSMLPSRHNNNDNNNSNNSYQALVQQLSKSWYLTTANDNNYSTSSPSNNPSNYDWCSSSSSRNNQTTWSGIYYTKVTKAASSTFAGINHQIACNVGQRQRQRLDSPQYVQTTSSSSLFSCQDDAYSCNHWEQHGIWYTYRQTPYFAWTSIRDPATRAISNFWFHFVSRNYQEPTDDAVLTYLASRKSFQLNYIAKLKQQRQPRHRQKEPSSSWKLRYNINQEVEQLQRKGSLTNSKQESTTKSNDNIIVQHALETIQKDVLDVYHFIAIAERMSESLIVLKLLLNLEYRDVIVLSAKQNGGYDDGKYKRKCHAIQKATNISRTVQEYLVDSFPIQNYDYMLYDIANRSLDKTIDALGRELVQSQIAILEQLQQVAEQPCQDKAQFPCSKNGTYQLDLSSKNCYSDDQGCGYPCVQQVLLSS